MRVCHVTSSHGAFDTRVFQRECRGLAAAGHDVTLIARNQREETVDGVKIIPLPQLGRLARQFVLPKIATARALALDADLYHFHDPGLLPWMSVLASRHGRKVLWDAHELYPDAVCEFNFNVLPKTTWAFGSVLDFVERKCCRSFSAVVTVTEPIRKRYEGLVPLTETIRNVVDFDALPPVRRRPNKSIFTFIASGTTNESRRVSTLLEAFSATADVAPNACLRLLASYDSVEAGERIRARVAERGLAGRVRLAPLAPWNTLMAEEIPYANVGLVLYSPTRNNLHALPNRLFEYWARGLPVIASDTPVLREVVGRNGGGIVTDADNPQALADAMLSYIRNPSAAAADGARGLRAVETMFNWRFELSKLLRLYEAIAALPPRSNCTS